jgi:hypothetical protein
MHFIKSLLALSLFTGTFAYSLDIDGPLYDTFQKSRIDVANASGNFIGIRRNYFEFGAFVPLSPYAEWMTFLDGRGYYFQNDKWAASVGGGVRTVLDDEYIVGANAYYDYLEGHFHKKFDRLGLGAELLTPRFDVRFNGYFPFKKSQTVTKFIIDVNGNSVFWQHHEVAVGYGFDAEVGMPLFSWGNFYTYGAVGPYYFDFGKRKPGRHSFWGAQGRLELEWNSYLSLQLRGSYDELYKCEAQFKIQFSVPFEALTGCFEDCCIERILQPVRRTGIIFSERDIFYFWN